MFAAMPAPRADSEHVFSPAAPVGKSACPACISSCFADRFEQLVSSRAADHLGGTADDRLSSRVDRAQGPSAPVDRPRLFSAVCPVWFTRKVDSFLSPARLCLDPGSTRPPASDHALDHQVERQRSENRWAAAVILGVRGFVVEMGAPEHAQPCRAAICWRGPRARGARSDRCWSERLFQKATMGSSTSRACRRTIVVQERRPAWANATAPTSHWPEIDQVD